MIKKTTKIYCDMDGVLANFMGKRKAVDRFAKEKGFFQKLKPIKNNVAAVRKMIDKGYDVYILTASPNEQADYDKRKWLDRYLPELPTKNLITCRLGDNKADFADVKNSILIDDYTHNLIAWKKGGGEVLKFVNKYDKEKGLHTLYNINFTKDLREVV